MNTNNHRKSGRFAQCSLSSFALPLIAEFAGDVIVPGTRRTGAQVCGIVVLLAELALAPVGMAAGIEGTTSPFDKAVVGVVLTEKQVLRAVIRSDAVPVVDFFGAFQIPPEDTFNHQNVLVDVSPTIRSRVSTQSLLDIPRYVRYAASPVRVAGSALHDPVALVKHQGLASNKAACGIRLLGERRRHPATALAKTRSINQSRAPKVCAESTTNLTLFRRLR